MYGIGRSLHGLVWGAAIFVVLSLWREGGCTTAAANPTEKMVAKPKVFSPRWLDAYHEGKLGCVMGRASYTWTPAGFGSNINNLLNAWVYANAAEGWSDLALIVDQALLNLVECSHESGGVASRGWSCVFSSMPHLCVFDTPETWQRHLNASGISNEDRNKTGGFTLQRIWSADFSTPLSRLDIDQLGAKTVMAKFLWSSMAPWFRQEVDVITHTWEIFETSPFIAIHIRRGDKLKETFGRVYSAEQYLSAVLEYLEETPTRIPADAIKGIWVASENGTAVDEVAAVANAYFPNVLRENIVFIAEGVPGGVEIPKVPTTSYTQDYASFVYLMADLQQLAAADVFVGTFSSNVGRLVVLLREGVGKPRDSALSLDYNWGPNRNRDLALNGI